MQSLRHVDKQGCIGGSRWAVANTESALVPCTESTSLLKVLFDVHDPVSTLSAADALSRLYENPSATQMTRVPKTKLKVDFSVQVTEAMDFIALKNAVAAVEASGLHGHVEERHCIVHRRDDVPVQSPVRVTFEVGPPISGYAALSRLQSCVHQLPPISAVPILDKPNGNTYEDNRSDGERDPVSPVNEMAESECLIEELHAQTIQRIWRKHRKISAERVPKRARSGRRPTRAMHATEPLSLGHAAPKRVTFVDVRRAILL